MFLFFCCADKSIDVKEEKKTSEKKTSEQKITPEGQKSLDDAIRFHQQNFQLGNNQDVHTRAALGIAGITNEPAPLPRPI